MYVYVYNRHAMVFVFSIFLPRRLILSFRKLFLFVRSRMFGFPPTTPLTDGRPYTAPSRPCTHYSAHQVIYSLSSRPSRNWKIHPSTRDKTGHIHGSVWFPNLCAATKNLVGDLLLRSRSPSPAPPHRWLAILYTYTLARRRYVAALYSAAFAAAIDSPPPLVEHPLHHLHALDNRGGLKLYESFGVFNRIRIIYNNI